MSACHSWTALLPQGLCYHSALREDQLGEVLGEVRALLPAAPTDWYFKGKNIWLCSCWTSANFTPLMVLPFFFFLSDAGWDEAGDEAHQDRQATDRLEFHRWTSATGYETIQWHTLKLSQPRDVLHGLAEQRGFFFVWFFLEHFCDRSATLKAHKSHPNLRLVCSRWVCLLCCFLAPSAGCTPALATQTFFLQVKWGQCKKEEWKRGVREYQHLPT